MSPLPPNVGFACFWLSPKKRTWSGTPWSLLQAFNRRTDVTLTDLELSLPSWKLLPAKIAGLRRDDRKWVSTWRWARSTMALQERAMRAACDGRQDLDAVLTIGENGAISKKQFIYQDYSLLHALHFLEHEGTLPYMFHFYPLEMIKRRASEQQAVFRDLAGIFTMSEWDKRYMVEHGIMSEDRVHVVKAGLNVEPHPMQVEVIRAQRTDEKRVLFIGREFTRKGGDLVFEAVKQLRDERKRSIKLVITGPTTWPLPTPKPEWVEFLSDVPYSVLQQEMLRTDVLALPSRFEAFGIAIVEALAAGIPVVARNDFAFPESIRHGVNGMLIESDSVDELAAAFLRVFDDEQITLNVRNDMERIRSVYSWDAVARDMTSVISSQVR